MWRASGTTLASVERVGRCSNSRAVRPESRGANRGPVRPVPGVRPAALGQGDSPGRDRGADPQAPPVAPRTGSAQLRPVGSGRAPKGVACGVGSPGAVRPGVVQARRGPDGRELLDRQGPARAAPQPHRRVVREASPAGQPSGQRAGRRARVGTGVDQVLAEPAPVLRALPQRLTSGPVAVAPLRVAARGEPRIAAATPEAARPRPVTGPDPRRPGRSGGSRAAPAAVAGSPRGHRAVPAAAAGSPRGRRAFPAGSPAGRPAVPAAAAGSPGAEEDPRRRGVPDGLANRAIIAIVPTGALLGEPTPPRGPRAHATVPSGEHPVERPAVTPGGHTIDVAASPPVPGPHGQPGLAQPKVRAPAALGPLTRRCRTRCS